MKALSILLLIVCSLSSFANTQEKFNELPYSEIDTILTQDIGTETTCLDEYLVREKHLRKFLIWAPPATVVAVPAAFMAAGYTTAAVSSAVGVTGWAGLGYTIAGASLAGVGVLGTFIGLETAKAIEFSNNRYMINLISAVHSRDFGNKTIRNFLKKYRKSYPNDINITDEDILHYIEDMDYNGNLCNGEIRGRVNTKKPHKQLVRRRHLLRYVHSQLGL